MKWENPFFGVSWFLGIEDRAQSFDQCLDKFSCSLGWSKLRIQMRMALNF